MVIFFFFLTGSFLPKPWLVWNSYEDKAGLETHKDPPGSAAQVVGLKEYTNHIPYLSLLG